jgi:uncharacterized protein (TIGR02453 family)
VFYLHLEPEGCFAAAGVWHPDATALLKIRNAIVSNPEKWNSVRKKLELEGEKLKRPPRGFDPKHPFAEDLKFKDYVASVGLTEKQICSDKFIRDFVNACKTTVPLVEFTTAALGLKY